MEFHCTTQAVNDVRHSVKTSQVEHLADTAV